MNVHKLLLNTFIVLLLISLLGLFNLKLGKDFEGYILFTVISEEPQSFKYEYIERKADKYFYEVSVPLSDEVKEAYKLKIKLISCIKDQLECQDIVSRLENLSGLMSNNTTSDYLNLLI